MSSRKLPNVGPRSRINSESLTDEINDDGGGKTSQPPIPRFIPVDPTLAGIPDEEEENILGLEQSGPGINEHENLSVSTCVTSGLSSNVGGAESLPQQSQSGIGDSAGVVNSNAQMGNYTSHLTSNVMMSVTYSPPIMSNSVALTTTTVQTPRGPHIPSQSEGLIQRQCQLRDNTFELLDFLMVNGVKNITVNGNHHNQLLNFNLRFQELGEEIPHTDPNCHTIQRNFLQIKLLLKSVRTLIVRTEERLYEQQERVKIERERVTFEKERQKEMFVTVDNQFQEFEKQYGQSTNWRKIMTTSRSLSAAPAEHPTALTYLPVSGDVSGTATTSKPAVQTQLTKAAWDKSTSLRQNCSVSRDTEYSRQMSRPIENRQLAVQMPQD